MLKDDNFYLTINGLVIGPMVKTNDNFYPFWCPRFNFRCYYENGKQSASYGMNDPYDIAEQVDAEKYRMIYAQIEKEFNFFTAAITCGMYHINLKKEIEYKHMTDIGSFTNELIEEFNSVFHWTKLSSSSYKCFKDALLCWNVLYDWECKQSLHGLGGCEKGTFKQLIEEANNGRF